MSRSRPLQLLAAGLSAGLILAACGGSDEPFATGTTGGNATPELATTTLNGSGATFPKAFYDAAIDGFGEVQPNVTVNYGGGGSGKGRTDLQGAWSTSPARTAWSRTRTRRSSRASSSTSRRWPRRSRSRTTSTA